MSDILLHDLTTWMRNYPLKNVKTITVVLGTKTMGAALLLNIQSGASTVNQHFQNLVFQLRFDAQLICNYSESM